MAPETNRPYPLPWSVEPGTASVVDADGNPVDLDLKTTDGRPNIALAEFIVDGLNAVAAAAEREG